MPGSTEVGKKRCGHNQKKKKKKLRAILITPTGQIWKKKKKVPIKLMMSGITGIMISQ